MTWIPVDDVAAAVSDLLFAPTLPPLLNVVHPKPVSWEAIMNVICAELKVSLGIVPLKDWLDRVETLSHNASSQVMNDVVGLVCITINNLV